MIWIFDMLLFNETNLLNKNDLKHDLNHKRPKYPFLFFLENLI